ncbi:MAG: type VI secretion system-associated FHA domain protein TagH, partial [Kofleriaceae bacterium]|nr:type VI secretion system-associated FHA domain protein TagH [Kofleriaceae bacterium]
LPPPQAARPVLPAPPPAVAPLPVADERPALTIGRLVVEVRPQAVASPAPATTIVRVAAPASSQAQTPSVLHRTFGLGQS